MGNIKSKCNFFTPNGCNNWNGMSKIYIAFAFAFIDVLYQNQILHWNPEAKQSETNVLFNIWNFKI